MRSILRRGVVTVVTFGAAHAAPAQMNATGGAQAASSLREAVADSVAANEFWAGLSGMAKDSTRIGEVPSIVVPGLIYHRASFSPPRTSHVGPFTSVGISRGDHARILNTVEDWSAIAQWIPSRASEAAAACGELIEALAFGRAYGRVFRSRRDIRYIFPETGQAAIRRSARRPSAARSADGSWVATVWYVTSGRTLQHRCAFSAAGAAPRISTLDSIPAGYFTGY
jgi:hypothetical protein